MTGSGSSRPYQDFVVVMTAAVTPAEGVRLVRADPGLRKCDYLDAFQFWLDHPDPRLGKILFLENSGAPLDDFATLAARSAKTVELLSAPAAAIPVNFHYGYAEMKALEYGLAHSRLLAETEFMIKATGRLKFPDIAKLLDRLPPDLEMAVDCRKRGRMFGSKRGFAPTQLFVAATDFYRGHFADASQRMKEGYYMEQLIYDDLLRLPGSERRMLRWPVSVEPEGFAAHASKRYDSASRLAVVGLRKALRVVAPSFWF